MHASSVYGAVTANHLAVLHTYRPLLAYLATCLLNTLCRPVPAYSETEAEEPQVEDLAGCWRLADRLSAVSTHDQR